MTTKTKSKIEQYRELEIFFNKINGRSNQPQRITERKEQFESTKVIETSN